jgi:HlyD family secretion protein
MQRDTQRNRGAVWLIVLLALLGALVGAIVLYQTVFKDDRTAVTTGRVERFERLRSIVSASGEIRAKEFVDIQAEIAAVIVELPVQEGNPVKQGDILLRLDDLQPKFELDGIKALLAASESEATSAEVAVATAQATLAGEKTALANLKVELEQARITRDRTRATWQRKKDLFEKKLITSEDFDIADADNRLGDRKVEWAEARVEQGDADLRAAGTRVEAAQAALEGARRRVEGNRASVARHEDLLSKTVIRSPLTGIITKLNVEKGERAVPGIQSNPQATLMTIADMSVVEAEIKVDETDIVTVKLGMPAEVEVDALRDVKIPGEVTEIGQSPIQTTSGSGGGMSSNQEAKDFKVVVRLQQPPEALRPGLSATADIVTAVRERVLVLPLQALTMREVEIDDQGRYVPPKREEKKGGGAFDGTVASAAPANPPVESSSGQRQKKKELEGVFVTEDGLARFRPVKTGATGEMEIELLEGLAEGATVITGPYKVLRTIQEFDAVRVDDQKKDASELRLRKRRR